jgi:hypothetical protein
MPIEAAGQRVLLLRTPLRVSLTPKGALGQFIVMDEE